MFFRKSCGIWIVGLMICSACSAEVLSDENGQQSNGLVTPAESGSTANPNPDKTVQKPVIIPLVNVWGHDRALRELEPELFIKRDTPEKRAEYSTPEKLQEIRDLAESSLTYQIERAMREGAMNENKTETQKFEDKQPAPGFAVVGRDRKALAGIHEVVVAGMEPQRKFSHKDEISLVYFTLNTGAVPRLIGAERVGTMINIQYALIANRKLYSYPRLYIIPVGKLLPGDYEVNPVRAHAEKPKYNDQRFDSYARGIEKSFVCQPFQFVVEDYSNVKD